LPTEIAIDTQKRNNNLIHCSSFMKILFLFIIVLWKDCRF